MSTAFPDRPDRPQRQNTAVQLRETFTDLNAMMLTRLAERGHADVRPAHGAVFQFIDDAGTSVARLAERAQMTKQAMGELVAHLEQHGYVVRRPDPADRRAKRVTLTERGREVHAIASELVPEIESGIDALLGPRRAAALRRDLELVRQAATDGRLGPTPT
jgi:DNA-binding MarR family transcriptional regulator